MRILLVLVLALLSGCADYLNHRDSITFGLGNAVEANKGIHIIDPMNPQSDNTRVYADGRRLAKVIGDYYGVAPQAGGPQPYQGNCLNEDDTAADGSRCGGRAALARPGGYGG